MSLRALILFATLFLEHDDLLAPSVINDGCGDARAVNERRTDSRFLVAARRDNKRFEFDLVASVFVYRGHAQRRAFLNAKLFAAGSDNCVSHNLSCSFKGLFVVEAR